MTKEKRLIATNKTEEEKHNGVTDSFTEMKVFYSPFLSDIGLAE